MAILCQVCLTENPSDRASFDSLVWPLSKTSVHQAFTECTSLFLVNFKEHFLCGPCLENLKVAFTFRADAIKANEKFSIVIKTELKEEPLEIFSEIPNNDDLLEMDQDESEENFPIFEDSLATIIKEELEDATSSSHSLNNSSDKEYSSEDIEPLLLEPTQRKKRKYTRRAQLQKPQKLNSIATSEEIEQFLAQALVEGSDFEYLEENTECHGRLKSYRCKRCDIKFNGFSSLNNHLRTVHDIKKPYKCVKCERRSSHIEILSNHMRNFCRGHVWTRKVPAPPPLKIAPAILLERERLNLSDIEEMEGDLKAVGGVLVRQPRYIKCKRCSARLTLAGVAKHFLEIHAISGAFKCETCLRRFEDVVQYNTHKKRFKGLCMSSTIRSDEPKAPKLSWRRHLEIKCDLCSGFNDVESYTTHMLRAHKIDQPFKCKDCQYRMYNLYFIDFKSFIIVFYWFQAEN